MATVQARPIGAGLGTQLAFFLSKVRTRFFLVELLLLIAAITMVVIVKGNPGPLPGDVRIILAWQEAVRPHHVPTAILETISIINWPLPAGIAATVIVAGFALVRRWLDIAVALATMAAASGTNFLTSQFVRRPRPEGFGIVVHQKIEHVFSFPSGHVEHALAFFGILVFLTFQLRRIPSWLSPALWLLRIYLIAQIVLMPFSRTLMGEHWPSDVLAGLLYGGFWLLVGIRVYPLAVRRWPRLVPANERRESAPAAS
jgi:membrane-associated phospholipid phosphatase